MCMDCLSHTRHSCKTLTAKNIHNFRIQFLGNEEQRNTMTKIFRGAKWTHDNSKNIKKTREKNKTAKLSK